MQPAEVLTAVTLNAAAAIGLADEIGSLEPGKQADLLIWDALTWISSATALAATWCPAYSKRANWSPKMDK